MNKIVILIFFFLSLPANAVEKSLQCKLQKSNFIMTFIFNVEAKTVFHKSSFDYLSKQKYDVYKSLKIIEWDYPYVWLFRSHIHKNDKSMILFDLSIPSYFANSIFHQSKKYGGDMFQSTLGDCLWN